jgi:HlyD family secretion protein
MKNNILITASTLLLLFITACNQNKKNFDASGAFEAEETIISSEASGVIRQLELEEGQELAAGQVVGYVDSLQLFLKKKQVEAQITALLGKKPDVPLQLAALEEQLKTAEKEQKRVTNLVKADAATTKQLDDINAQVELIGKQIASQRSTLNLSSEGISNDAVSLQVQAEQLNDQLRKCSIVNPVKGTVLLKYAEPNEMTVTGKPLYKIADLSSLTLRAYITGNQLPLVKLGQPVKVLTDDGNGGFKESAGSITWISNKSEFTPKTIQTKDERANLVYAIKVKVKNDGALKIGMYAEIKF